MIVRAQPHIPTCSSSAVTGSQRSSEQLQSPSQKLCTWSGRWWLHACICLYQKGVVQSPCQGQCAAGVDLCQLASPRLAKLPFVMNPARPPTARNGA